MVPGRYPGDIKDVGRPHARPVACENIILYELLQTMQVSALLTFLFQFHKHTGCIRIKSVILLWKCVIVHCKNITREKSPANSRAARSRCTCTN